MLSYVGLLLSMLDADQSTFTELIVTEVKKSRRTLCYLLKQGKKNRHWLQDNFMRKPIL
jgi:hypothetical protein